jgi:hypothetical protein
MVEIFYELDEVAPSSFKTILINHLIRCIQKPIFFSVNSKVVSVLLKIDVIVHTTLYNHSCIYFNCLTKNSVSNLFSGKNEKNTQITIINTIFFKVTIYKIHDILNFKRSDGCIYFIMCVCVYARKYSKKYF